MGDTSRGHFLTRFRQTPLSKTDVGRWYFNGPSRLFGRLDLDQLVPLHPTHDVTGHPLLLRSLCLCPRLLHISNNLSHARRRLLSHIRARPRDHHSTQFLRMRYRKLQEQGKATRSCTQLVTLGLVVNYVTVVKVLAP